MFFRTSNDIKYSKLTPFQISFKWLLEEKRNGKECQSQNEVGRDSVDLGSSLDQQMRPCSFPAAVVTSKVVEKELTGLSVKN